MRKAPADKNAEDMHYYYYYSYYYYYYHAKNGGDSTNLAQNGPIASGNYTTAAIISSLVLASAGYMVSKKNSKTSDEFSRA